MKLIHTQAIVIAMSVLTSPSAAFGQRLTTAPWDDGTPEDGAGVFVDLATGHDSLVITEIGYTFATLGVPARLRIWQRSGSYVGFDGSSDGWVVVDQIDVTSNDDPRPTPVVLNNPITLTYFDRHGFFLEGEIDGLLFTGAPGEPPPQVEWENEDLYLFSDVVRLAPFSGPRIDPACFSGYIQYEPGPELNARGECPGPITVEVAGATSGGYVALAYAFGEGLSQIPPGRPCAGVTLGLDDSARLIGRRVADENGMVSVTLNAPPSACDRVFIQAIDVERCALTNLISL